MTLVIGLLCFGGACFGLGALLVMYAVFGWDVWIGEDETGPSPDERHHHDGIDGSVFDGRLADCPRCDMTDPRSPYGAKWASVVTPVNQADLEPGVTYRPLTVAVPKEWLMSGVAYDSLRQAFGEPDRITTVYVTRPMDDNATWTST